MLWASENFFRLNETLYHEVALYFAVSLPANAHRDLSACIVGTESGTSFECRWHSINSLSHLRIVPGFLANGLADLPEAAQHIVQIDPSAAPYLKHADARTAGRIGGSISLRHAPQRQSCGIGSSGGQRLSLAPYVTVTGPVDRVTAAGGH
jgi:hypothetical protein